MQSMVLQKQHSKLKRRQVTPSLGRTGEPGTLSVKQHAFYTRQSMKLQRGQVD